MANQIHEKFIQKREWELINSSHTALDNTKLKIDTTSGMIPITLPTTPIDNSEIRLISNNESRNGIRIIPNGKNIKFNLKTYSDPDYVEFKKENLNIIIIYDQINDYWMLFEINDGITGISESTTLNVPSEFTTVKEALDYLKDKIWSSGVDVTIEVDDGTYELNYITVIDHKNNVIKIKGKNHIDKNILALVSVTGSSGDWEVTVTLDNLDGLQIGQYANISGVIGTGTTDGVNGCWEIIGIGGGNVTVKNTRRLTTFPSTITTGNFRVFLTQFKSSVGYENILFLCKTDSYFENLFFLGSSLNIGLGHDNVAITTDIIKTSNIEIHNCGFSNLHWGFRSYNGYVYGTGCYLSGNEQAIFSHISGDINIDYCIINGNEFGITGSENGRIRAPFCHINGNSVDVFANENSKISQLSFDATSVYSPAWRTLGNHNSFIS